MSIWQPLANLIARRADIARPLRPATVLSVAGWSAIGAGYITVLCGDVARRAAYRDGRAPVEGEVVQVARMGPGAGAGWLALPLPGVATATFATFAVVFDNTWYEGSPVNNPGDDAFMVVVRTPPDGTGLDYLDGHPVTTWQRLAVVPVSQANWEDQFLIGSTRADTLVRLRRQYDGSWVLWMVPEGAGTVRLGLNSTTAEIDNVYISDDGGLTWRFLQNSAALNGGARHIEGNIVTARDGRAIAFDAAASGELYSLDGGATTVNPAGVNFNTGGRWFGAWADRAAMMAYTVAYRNGGTPDPDADVGGMYWVMVRAQGTYVLRIDGTNGDRVLWGPFGPSYDSNWPICHFYPTTDDHDDGWLVWEVEGPDYSTICAASYADLLTSSPSPTITTVYAGGSLTNPPTDYPADLARAIPGNAEAASMALDLGAGLHGAPGDNPRAVVDLTDPDLPQVAVSLLAADESAYIGLAGGQRQGARYDGDARRVLGLTLTAAGGGLFTKGAVTDATGSFYADTGPLGEHYTFFRGVPS